MRPHCSQAKLFSLNNDSLSSNRLQRLQQYCIASRIRCERQPLHATVKGVAAATESAPP